MSRPLLCVSAYLLVSVAFSGPSSTCAQEVSSTRAAKALTAAEEGALKPGDSFKECDDCPEMVVVPTGEFIMGSPPGEAGRYDNEGPRRLVTIARPFAVGKFEVTFAEWDACLAAGACMRRLPPGDEGWGSGRLPVIGISWNDIADDYLPWLSRTTGKTYRLLTEAEWEYAARGVTSPSTPVKSYWWGDQASHEYANYGMDQCCRGYKQGRDQWENTAPVGQFPANPFGLHDMHGNVWEWVHDCYTDGYAGGPVDGSAVTPVDCRLRVLRGGSYYEIPLGLRSAMRHRSKPEYINLNYGFRVGRTL